MALSTFVLVPGVDGAAWYWHLVAPRLRADGHRVVSVELPVAPGTTLSDQADAIVVAAGNATEVVVVAQSMGGFSAPLAVPRLPVTHFFLVNAMIPLPGETAGEWWEATGQAAAMRANEAHAGRDPDAGFDVHTHFFHDVPSAVVDEALAVEVTGAADSVFADPCDFARWPPVPTTVLSGRDDRFFPYDFQRRVAAERLGRIAEPLPGGHLIALSQPQALAARLLRA